MTTFMGPNYLLESDTAVWLYHEVAAKQPIIDYHCHIQPAEILADRRFQNLTEAWLEGDHYKWRLMRADGIDERLITGDAGAREKYDAYVGMLPRAIGNPLYAWSHLELQRYIGTDLVIKPANADAIWEAGCRVLPTLGVRDLIRMSKVEVIVTTDDPVSDLAEHARLDADPAWDVRVLPGIRPDSALAFDTPGYLDYLSSLAAAAGLEAIRSYDDLLTALERRVDFFAGRGCVTSDHGLHHMPLPDPTANPAELFRRVLAGESLDGRETDALTADVLVNFAKMIHRHDWVMQLHVNALRRINTRMTRLLGPDTGFDVMHEQPLATATARLLDAMDQNGHLPRVVLYSLNPHDDTILSTIAGSFPGVRGQVRHGAAWWFNDTRSGMEAQLENYANTSLLVNFAGMLTDSRSFLSYVRHEYFRRLFANVIGGYVERGEYPNDPDTLAWIMRRVCYENSRDMLLKKQ